MAALPEKPYEVRCPLHGSIAFGERERRIIDHPFFQRLRSISQLGFSALVYPGATHTRFSHALGVMGLAGRVFDQIVAAPGGGLAGALSAKSIRYCRQTLRFAGLLHDVGHPPFSHSFEALLPALGTLPLPRNWFSDFDPGRQATHEDFSVAVIHALAGGSKGLLSLEEAQDIAALVHGSVAPTSALTEPDGRSERNIYPLLKQIVSGEIDADRMDYLPRDALFAGVTYGYFDQERLISALTCVDTGQHLTLALDHSALYTYENFLMTRFHMAMQVYLHKTVLLFEHYLHRAVREGEIECPLDGGLEEFLAAREDIVSGKLFAARARRWAGRIVERRPFPRLIQLKDGTAPEQRERILRTLAQAEIETIHVREEKRLSSLGTVANGDAPEILVREWALGRQSHRPLHEVSVLLERYNQVFTIENVYCAPQHYRKGIELLREVV